MDGQQDDKQDDETGTVPVSARLPAEMVAWLDGRAGKLDRSRSKLIQRMLQKMIDANDSGE